MIDLKRQLRRASITTCPVPLTHLIGPCNMRRTVTPAASSLSSSSPASLSFWGFSSYHGATAILVIAVTAAGAALHYVYQHHDLSPQKRQSRAYIDALHQIARSAGAVRQISALTPSEAEDDESRYARRHAFFTHFFTHVLGGDQGRYKFIHVTGTKGKGTVCELVRCGLIAHGKRVGTFTSPHLHTVRERIRVNDVLISRADFVRLWHKVHAALVPSGIDDAGPVRCGGTWANFFDKVLGVALAWFVEQQVEYIILEVGIGGRYDPTNFIATPLVCV